MTLTIPQRKRESARRVGKLTRRITAIIGVSALMFQLVHADPIQTNQVVQTVNSLHGTIDLQLQSLSQQPVSDTRVGAPNGQAANDPKAETKTELVAGDITSDPGKIGVDIAADAIVEGTVCDCGEILIPGAAFPKWPLLFLAGIPFIFINGCDDCDTQCLTCDSVTVPTPSPQVQPFNLPESSVPEPASLFLFGTGLLAFASGLRRRYLKANAVNQIKSEVNKK